MEHCPRRNQPGPAELGNRVLPIGSKLGPKSRSCAFSIPGDHRLRSLKGTVPQSMALGLPLVVPLANVMTGFLCHEGGFALLHF